jgi:Inner membrane protein YgaP-like, transmembrane domain
MKRLLSPNISKTGRQVRGGISILLFLGAGFAFTFCLWLGLALLLSGGFVLFEAVRGWCALRACGIKTRI